MKPVKEIVFEYVRQTIYSNAEYAQGIETKMIAVNLKMQRSNVSTLLNELVKEEKLIKTTTRPVLYKLPVQSEQWDTSAEFAGLIGKDGSLKNAVQLAKAAILYPNPRKHLNVLIASEFGCGTTFFATLMHQFAKNRCVLSKDAPFVKINCRNYSKNVSVLNEELFGDNSLFHKAKGGMLFIDYFDLLDVKQQNQIFSFLETGLIQNQDFSDVYLVLSCSIQNVDMTNNKIPVVIELPKLSERPFQEKLELINEFFTQEAQNSKKSIEVESEAIKALLLTDYTYNIKELRKEILSACANGYVRVVNEPNKNIYICVNDFSSKVKRSLLKLKDARNEIDAIFGNQEYFLYDGNEGYQNRKMDTFYANIQNQYNELQSRGVNPTSIEDVINNHIRTLFNKYSYKYEDDENVNLEQLSKLVDKKVINMVTVFLDKYQEDFGIKIKTSIFFALCLHINSLMNKNNLHQRVSNDQIVMTIQNYPKEYAATVSFCDVLKKELSLDLDIGEIVIITMILVGKEENEDEAKPVLLYIMHGNGTAKSLCDVTNALTHCDNAYSYDLKLQKNTQQAMEEIKELIIKIDRGAGILVIYDMGSIKTMLETISEEVNIKIRFMNIPITLLGIDIARKCSMESDVDLVYHSANLDFQNFNQRNNQRNSVIITLCHTGEGGALQLKNYIDQYSHLGMKTIAFAISNRDALVKEVMNLKRIYNIHAFVSTYDPKLLGIPFIPISEVFRVKPEQIDRILLFEPIHSTSINYEQVYNYLEEQLKYTSISKLKTVLPECMDGLSLLYSLNEDQILGIFVHMACLIERSLSGEVAKKNPDTQKIITALEDDYKAIAKILKRIEKTFKIIIGDHEIANLIMMVKKI